ncbi:hypothetical protein GCM10022248_89910 [Nonomuraea soli]
MSLDADDGLALNRGGGEGLEGGDAGEGCRESARWSAKPEGRAWARPSGINARAAHTPGVSRSRPPTRCFTRLFLRSAPLFQPVFRSVCQLAFRPCFALFSQSVSRAVSAFAERPVRWIGRRPTACGGGRGRAER